MTIPYEKSLASHPNVTSWHPTKNGDITPRDVSKWSVKMYWFKCNKCLHVFKEKPKNIFRTVSGCIYCTNKKLCDNNECQTCFEKSFASHPKVSIWHPTKNGDRKPRDIFKSSNKKVWFLCDKCSHDFENCIVKINGGRQGCTYCANKTLCSDEGCQTCFEKSFASHPKVDFWHPTKNGDIKPRDIFKSSSKKAWFLCGKCSHDFESVLNSISYGRWCGYCAIPLQKLCDDEGCQFCYERSFASHTKAEFWHPTKNGSVKPRNVAKGTRDKYWFKCDICLNDFWASINCITASDSWCSICTNKTEKKLYEALIGYYPDTKGQFTAKWCKNSETGRYYPFDFCIKSKKVIIELDGRQHFEDVKHWNSSFEDRHSIDLVKQLDANDNGYRVIRIVQEDVWTDRYDWLTELLKNIQDDTHQNVFMCKDGEYDFFIESINHLKSASAV